MRRGATIASGVAAVLVVAAVGTTLALGGSKAARTGPDATALARVVRTDVVARQQVSGTLDYSGSYAVAAGAPGVVTWLPQVGTVVRRGGRLFELDDHRVTLLYGARPASRDLVLGVSDGPDVLQLKRNLRALGYTADGAMTVDPRFDLATVAAVEAWQRATGQQSTGEVTLGSAVFLPRALRVAATVTSPGATVQAGTSVLAGTSATPAVLVPLDPATVSRLSPGDAVIVTMPDGSEVRGYVAEIGRVATEPNPNDSGGSPTPTIPVTITLAADGSRGALDQAPVQAAIVTARDRDVLAAPISALLARPGGGYAVQAADGRLVAVTTGLFDDVAGRVEISGPGVRAGMPVQVPAG